MRFGAMSSNNWQSVEAEPPSDYASADLHASSTRQTVCSRATASRRSLAQRVEPGATRATRTRAGVPISLHQQAMMNLPYEGSFGCDLPGRTHYTDIDFASSARAAALNLYLMASSDPTTSRRYRLAIVRSPTTDARRASIRRRCSPAAVNLLSANHVLSGFHDLAAELPFIDLSPPPLSDDLAACVTGQHARRHLDGGGANNTAV